MDTLPDSTAVTSIPRTPPRSFLADYFPSRLSRVVIYDVHPLSDDSDDSDDIPALEDPIELTMPNPSHDEYIKVVSVGWAGFDRGSSDPDFRSVRLLWSMNNLIAVSLEWDTFATSVLMSLRSDIPFTIPQTPYDMKFTLVWQHTPDSPPFCRRRTPYCMYFHVQGSRSASADLHLAALGYYLSDKRLKENHKTSHDLATDVIDRIYITDHRADYSVGVILAKDSFAPVFVSACLRCNSDRSEFDFKHGNLLVSVSQPIAGPRDIVVHARLDAMFEAARSFRLA